MSRRDRSMDQPADWRMDRRRFVGVAAAGLAASALPACSPRGTEPQSPVVFAPGKPLPWINWAGNQHCYPQQRFAPRNEDEVIEALKSARGVIRPVGASHSFSAVVPTDDTLITTDLLSGVIAHDPATLQAEIWAGTRMFDLGLLLDGIGQALPNQPDMNYPAMGGAIVNAVHATGAGFGSMSAYVTGLTLATPSGELLECDATRNREVFQAARTSVGALGVITRLRLQNQAAFRITELNRVERTEDVLDDLERRMREHRHFELMPMTNTDFAITVSTDLAKAGDTAHGEDDPQTILAVRKVFDAVRWIPGMGIAAYQHLLQAALGSETETVRTGPSHVVFPHVRIVRFREMEYTVPAEAGPACVREILHTIRARKLPICFPLEYRQVKADDIWLSMFEGRDGAAISVHQFGDIDYRPYFAVIEPIFWKYDGRPHWGKIHTLDAPRLAALYPHWQDFHEVRRALDPGRRMINPHLATIFGD